MVPTEGEAKYYYILNKVLMKLSHFSLCDFFFKKSNSLSNVCAIIGYDVQDKIIFALGNTVGFPERAILNDGA